MANTSLGTKLQSLPKPLLFGILILLTSVPLFFQIKVPNVPVDSSMDMYRTLMDLPTDKPVLISSDWTNSTRGESGGQFESLVRILMRRGIKFVVYTAADPQAPQVARDSIARLNDERRAKGQKPYESWNDWLHLGYFPNAEATGQAIANDVRRAFGGRKAVPPGGSSALPVFQSPTLKSVQEVDDFGLVVIVTASKTSTIAIERLYGKVPLALMVTGVMGPESVNYYTSGQVEGLVTGLKGLFDMETLMENGIQAAGGKPAVPGWPGEMNVGKGTIYYPTLHFALALLIFVVILGNVGMFLSKREGKR